MIRSALEYIVGMKKPEIVMIKGETYADKDLRRVSYNPHASHIELHSLSGLVDYIKSGFDEMGDMFIHIKSATNIEFFSALDFDRTREKIAVVRAEVPEFRFDSYMDHEIFVVNMQSKCIPDKATDRELILKFAGTVESGTVAQYGDDGVSQKATVKTGIASKSDAIVPNPVRLRMYRTFIEVDQPVAQYVFRMREDQRSGVECALFEADGGAWELEAKNRIAEYLKKELGEFDNIKVIA